MSLVPLLHSNSLLACWGLEGFNHFPRRWKVGNPRAKSKRYIHKHPVWNVLMSWLGLRVSEVGHSAILVVRTWPWVKRSVLKMVPW